MGVHRVAGTGAVQRAGNVTLALALLILAALADAYTSYRLFKRGGVELNPLVVKLFGKRPNLGDMLVVKAVAIAIIAYSGEPALHYLGAAVWGAAAIYNSRLK